MFEQFYLDAIFFLVCPMSFAFSCIPGMVGGKLLESYLRRQARKGDLTRRGAVIC
jgi:hypothetical protein